MSSFRGKLLLVNFWATWCPPCVEELPLLDYFFQENRDKNMQVLGLAVDQPSKVRTGCRPNRCIFRSAWLAWAAPSSANRWATRRQPAFYGGVQRHGRTAASQDRPGEA
jgi:thiol-disulfide isomerase/thioredoxin